MVVSQPSLRQVLTDPALLLALGFGSGLVKRAPGTCGSIVAMLPFLLLTQLPTWMYIALVGIAFVLGVYLCGRAAAMLGLKDPGAVVWDEFVGMWVTLFLVPEGWQFLFLGLLLFRFFDIVKPWPVGYLDRNVSGGLGIMVDDVVAGMYAFLSLQLLAHLLGHLI